MESDLISSISIGLATALTWSNLGFCLGGVLLGMFVGVLPGIGAMTAISMLMPLVYHLDPTSALIMLGGIWYGTAYGGSIASILLNLPGTPSTAVTCLDGYPMARQGRAGIALFMTTVASFFGASMGIILMMLFSPVIVNVAFNFTSAEYFSLMVLGLIAASTISAESPIKGLAMVGTGILLGLVGMDLYASVPRFTLGFYELLEGISLVALALGIFGVAEIIASARTDQSGTLMSKVTFRSMIPTQDDRRRSLMPMVRGSGVGVFFGILPGIGPSIASFLAYAWERKVADEPQRFGHGAIEGIIAPEAANNAADQAAFIPTMTLGIPGSPTMALIIGVLIIHGITPGPTLVTERPDLFWGLIMSFWIGNILLLIINIPLIGIWVRLLQVPYGYLYPAVVMFMCIGAFTIHNNPFDVFSIMVFGLMGYGMRVLAFPVAPLILGFVLGPLMEEHFRRAMTISFGDPMVFLQRPVSAGILAITALFLLFSLVSFIRAKAAGTRARGS
ncbi:tripartite tricarboxylate transporter permease [Paracoccus pantotrophus]|uniref:tripartite tricarboxylate transporter permease n=1 Tax=Paracoccus pantotrophus TaxID=82367 RepID=UPI00048FECE5|nr:tripartite tricarboxylate transporter permease [Paracoccus pantotrophus]